MSSSSWGLGPYGLIPWGSATPGMMSLQDAVAISTHEVRILLSSEPQNISPNKPGDALNPDTWTIQRLDTAELLTVVTVVKESDLVYVLFSIDPFGPNGVTHTVSTNSLMDFSGARINPPRSADFAGIVSSRDDVLSQLANRQVQARDIANPQVPRADSSVQGGTLVIAESGDYATVTGVELVKKLILRRLTTSKGGFFHLPNYGVGLGVKEPVVGGDLVRLKFEIERQVLEEPEVDGVLATLEQSANTLSIALRSRLRSTGEVFDLALAVPQSSVVL